jgi:hypothetical protein
LCKETTSNGEPEFRARYSGPSSSSTSGGSRGFGAIGRHAGAPFPPPRRPRRSPSTVGAPVAGALPCLPASTVGAPSRRRMERLQLSLLSPAQMRSRRQGVQFCISSLLLCILPLLNAHSVGVDALRE